MPRTKEYTSLTPDDWRLIQACKAHRDELAARIKVLKAMGERRHRKEIARLIAERRQLTDESLAEKFETSKYQIGQL